MSKYKAGDKVVLEVLSIDGDGYYIVGSEHYSWWAAPKILDEVVEPLSAYTEPLEAKIRRQASHITYLEGKVKELKSDLKHGRTIEDDCDPEAKRAAGQEEAWKLARKCMLMTDREREAIFGSGHNALYGVLTYFDYKHAAAKVAEWERKKKEICVGDVLLSKTIPTKCIVISFEKLENTACILWKDGSSGKRNINELKKDFKKIGHIDIASMLEQIGD